jgi:carboxyl-terminal processing protease
MRCVRALSLLLLAIPAWSQIATLALPTAQPSAEERQLAIDTFEKVWTTIRDKHWEKNPGGLDWQAIHEEYRPRIEKAANIEEVREILKDMLSRLHQTHFAILPATVYAAVQDFDTPGDGVTGIDLRVLDGEAIVTGVDPGSPAERAGVKPGWAVLSAKGVNLEAAAKALSADPSIPEIVYTRVLTARISGAIGGMLPIEFLDGDGNHRDLTLGLEATRGEPSTFGNLPETRVWFESKQIDGAGYVRFNYFLDLPHVMEGFGNEIRACQKCSGLVIDLRGNPGGLGAMAMGMAGYLVDMPGLRLGTMYTRDAQLNFAVNPRYPDFKGPVAMLVDGCSASTSEIFAGGLKDLGRARIFGTKSAAAALPSVIEKLPNGDGFQYAVGNYISEGGKPLEGEGVMPNVEVKLTRNALLAGHDPVLEAALDWIKQEGTKK